MGTSIESAVPKNPPLLLLDTDVLFQILLTEQISILRHIKKRYCMQPAVVEAVDGEIRTNKKFRSRFTKVYQKALDCATIQQLDIRTLPAYVTTDPRSVYESIQTRGLQHKLVLGSGEAYTHAAAVVLRVPAASNDNQALIVADNNGLEIQKPVLRMFDLVVFALQTGLLSERDCDNIRKKLVEENEGVPDRFRRRSFRDGLPEFYARLVDGFLPTVGSANAISPRDERITVLAC